MSLKDKNILLGVSGSIAAYKAAFLTRLLVKAGANVKVILTEGAMDFVQPITFATLSKNDCLHSFTRPDKSNWHNHVQLGLWADILLIAPATANTLFKLAHGHCDNLLTGVYLSARCPVLIAPAMDEDMWNHPSTQNNLALLESYGNRIIPVGTGELASGLNGPGRMAEPEEILAFLETFMEDGIDGPLKGKHIVITAGPTYEPLDPVRFIGNHSTGKMGLALAEEAKMRGAQVHLILGPSNVTPSQDIRLTRVTTGKDMHDAAKKEFSKADIFIFAAAVADYTPAKVAKQKIKKEDGNLQVELVRTKDIAQEFGKRKKKGQISVGFALETEKGLENARHKLEKKNFDMIVLNSLSDEGAGFRHDTNKVTILDKNNKTEKYELKSKEKVAGDILDKLQGLL